MKKISLFDNIKHVLLLVSLCFIVFSCTTNASVDVEGTSSGTFLFETEASNGVESIVRSFSGAGSTISVFDKGLIEESFRKADLILLSFDTRGTAGLSLMGKAENINNLVPSENQIIFFENTDTGGALSLYINNSTMTSLLSLMGEENLVYVELLQAPIFTGFQMSKEEYLSFISALYGQGMSEELKESIITFELIVPSNIQTVSLEPSSVGTIHYAQNKANLSISLADFLANTDEITLSIDW